jgi:hypothetical protein
MDDHLCHIVDFPTVESPVFAQVAQLALFVHQLWHRSDAHANQLQSKNNFQDNIPKPTTEGTGSGGIDTDAPYHILLPYSTTRT